MTNNEPWRAIIIGGTLPGLGDFEHHVAIPKGLPTQDAMMAYFYDKTFRKACVRFDSAKAAADAVEEHNAKLMGRKQ